MDSNWPSMGITPGRDEVSAAAYSFARQSSVQPPLVILPIRYGTGVTTIAPQLSQGLSLESRIMSSPIHYLLNSFCMEENGMS